MKELKNIAYGNDPAQHLDIYLPDGEVKTTFIYFHGGGLECCICIYNTYYKSFDSLQPFQTSVFGL